MQKNLQFSYLFNYLLIFNSQFEDFRLQMKVLITKENNSDFIDFWRLFKNNDWIKKSFLFFSQIKKHNKKQILFFNFFDIYYNFFNDKKFTEDFIKLKFGKQTLNTTTLFNLFDFIQEYQTNLSFSWFTSKTFSVNLKSILDSFSFELNEEDKKTDSFVNEGVVVGFKDSVVTLNGLSGVMLNELIYFENGAAGLVLNLEIYLVRALVFGGNTSVFVGEHAKRSGYVMRVPVGDAFLGRIVNPLGNPLDGYGFITSSSYMNIERKAPGVITRKKVFEPVVTGVKVIDALVPIGRGQRELVLGDRKTGKTMLVVDTILNQSRTFFSHEFPLICIYVAIGKRKTEVNKLWKIISENNSQAYTIFVVAGASDPASLQFIAPYVGCTLAEFFSFNSKHTLVIYDDLSKHADVYRQISLLLRRPVGREAYPGDVFYLHSRLLERALKLNENFGEGSLTALPIVETIQGDVSAYIPTNIISITDGQIYLDWDRHQQGIRPAIDPGISVSRIGASAQVNYMKKLAGSLKLELAQYREVEQFSKLGSELDSQTLKMLQKGQLLTEILKQKRNQPLSLSHQIFNLYLVHKAFPSIRNRSAILDIYNRFLTLFIYFSVFFMPFDYILNLTDKKKQSLFSLDLNFLANIFWKLYVFQDVANTDWIKAWRRHFFINDLNLDFILKNIWCQK